jgi:hypothetical protein
MAIAKGGPYLGLIGWWYVNNNAEENMGNIVVILNDVMLNGNGAILWH